MSALNHDRCGIGRCKDYAVLIGNGVPMCHKHWVECCDSGLPTTEWLKKRARAEWRSEIIDPSTDSELSGTKTADKEPTKSVKLRRRRRSGLIAKGA